MADNTSDTVEPLSREQILQWIDACNLSAAKQVLRDYLTQADEVEWLREENARLRQEWDKALRSLVEAEAALRNKS